MEGIASVPWRVRTVEGGNRPESTSDIPISSSDSELKGEQEQSSFCVYYQYIDVSARA
jgi:hypothetical protein